jgi:hypothetical protein
MIQHVHGNSIDHGHFAMVIFENKDHVKVLQMKLHTFKMYQLNVLKGGNKWRLLTEYTQNQLPDVTGGA